MTKHPWWTIWSAVSATWVGYLVWFVWFRWSEPAAMDRFVDYLVSVATFIVPPLALAYLGMGVRYTYRRIASLTRQAS